MLETGVSLLFGMLVEGGVGVGVVVGVVLFLGGGMAGVVVTKVRSIF